MLMPAFGETLFATSDFFFASLDSVPDVIARDLQQWRGREGILEQALNEASLALSVVLLQVLEVCRCARGDHSISNGFRVANKFSVLVGSVVCLLLLILRRRSHQFSEIAAYSAG